MTVTVGRDFYLRDNDISAPDELIQIRVYACIRVCMHVGMLYVCLYVCMYVHVLVSL